MQKWDAEKSLDTIRNVGRFGKKRVMEAVYKSNMAIFRDWGYRLPSGGIVGLGDRQALLNGTKVYSREFSVADAPCLMGETKTGCVNADCVDVAKGLLDRRLNPAILNLASRRHPCGGYDRGMSAQEETLCRLSTLSQSLYQYYDPKYKCVRDAEVPHKFNAYPLEMRFGGIYSPGVTFFRKNWREGFAFREDPFTCAVISVAALSFREPNRYCNEERRYMSPEGGFTTEGDSIQLDKIRTICRIALKNGHDSIVLGAFGCGVNLLPCNAVADQFRRVFGEPEFDRKFRVLVFAMLEGRGNARRPVEENGKFGPFYSIYGRCSD